MVPKMFVQTENIQRRLLLKINHLYFSNVKKMLKMKKYFAMSEKVCNFAM